ncbi:MAG TPA: hypothetical protein DD379_08050 [Cyanobacteria bacterium UBA11162]|nr:hypothetical protein [Cyanobacteria bacterium UBA11162]
MKLLHITITTALFVLIGSLVGQQALAEPLSIHDLIPTPDFFEQGREEFEEEIEQLYHHQGENNSDDASEPSETILKITVDPQAEIEDHLSHLEPSDLSQVQR